MNTAQTIFTLFYGLYFATTIPMTALLRPFDTPAMYGKDGRAWLRFFASLVLLNVLPLFYFVFVYEKLSGLNAFEVRFGPTLTLFILSLAGFGFYRFSFGIMLSRTSAGYLFYGEKLPVRVADELDQRSSRQREVLPHVIPGIAWVALCLSGLLWI